MIITLCGSARFEPYFHLWNEVLSLAGHAVFGLAVYPSQKDGRKDWYIPEEKAAFDQAHLNKITVSDAILVLNPFAYLGESTLREIAYAYSIAGSNRRLPVYFLQSWGRDCGPGAAGGPGPGGARYGVPEGWVSPISTVRDLNPFDLLGPFGDRRSVLAGRVCRREIELAGAPTSAGRP